MLEPAFGIVPLNPLRSAVDPIFRSYDRAVKLNDGLAASRAKKAIVAEGKRALAPLCVEQVGGVYLFLQHVPSSLGDLRYIGRSRPSRPLARRIVDRFRDDTALDQSLYELPETDVEEIAYTRMRIAMRSRAEILRKFAQKHCRTMAEFKHLSHIVVVPIVAPQAVVDDVEHLLIYTASQIGCRLTNVQERRRLRAEACHQIRRALCIVEDLRGVLDGTLYQEWSTAIGSLAD